MIKFKNIKFKNILSAGNVEIEVILDTGQNTIITGKNGTGKTLLLDALSFVNYGRAFRDINKAQIINSINQKNLLVTQEFDVGINEYKVVRGIKPDKFEIYKNGDLLPRTGDVRDYQNMLENEILKMSFKTFSQVILVGSATFTPFMQLTPSDRRKIIEDLLDCQIFSSMSLLAKGRMDQIKSDLLELKTKINSLSEAIVTMQEMIDAESSSSEEEIQSIKNMIIIYETKKSDLQKQINLINEDIEKSILEVTKIPVTLKDAQDKNNSLSNKISSQKANIKTLSNTINFIENNDDCPTCKQSISNDHKCEIKTKNQTEIDKLQLNNTAETKKLDFVLEIINKINDLQNKISSFRNNLRIHENSMVSLNEMINSQNQLILKLNEKKQSSIPEGKINELKNEIKIHNTRYDDQSKKSDSFKIIQSLLKDNGIKTIIIGKYIPKLNNLINKYLESLDFFCSFELDEEFNETIKSRYRDTFSYKSFSEGEKMRVNLAILFAFRDIARMRNSAVCNLLIMDEVIDSSLDNIATDDFLNILRSFEENQNIFVISHNSETIQGFDRVINVEKHGNFTEYRVT